MSVEYSSFPVEPVHIGKITVNNRFQMRCDLIDNHVDALVVALRNDPALLEQYPILLAEIDDRLYPVDGFHRLTAAAQCPMTVVHCRIVAKTELEALKVAVSANDHTGSPATRSQADRRKALTAVLDNADLRKLTDDQIAKMVGVSRVTVGNHRKTNPDWRVDERIDSTGKTVSAAATGGANIKPKPGVNLTPPSPVVDAGVNLTPPKPVDPLAGLAPAQRRDEMYQRWILEKHPEIANTCPGWKTVPVSDIVEMVIAKHNGRTDFSIPSDVQRQLDRVKPLTNTINKIKTAVLSNKLLETAGSFVGCDDPADLIVPLLAELAQLRAKPAKSKQPAKPKQTPFDLLMSHIENHPDNTPATLSAITDRNSSKWLKRLSTDELDRIKTAAAAKKLKMTEPKA